MIQVDSHTSVEKERTVHNIEYLKEKMGINVYKFNSYVHLRDRRKTVLCKTLIFYIANGLLYVWFYVNLSF